MTGADVFISHKTEDKPRLRPLLDALRAEGLSVWWDEDTGGGASWRQTIEAELDAARCVLVCWSARAVTAPYVLEEAERAKRRGALLPVRIDAVAPPFGFGETQARDLVGWQGDTGDVRWRRLLADVRRLVVEGPHPPPAPPPPPPVWPKVARVGGALALLAALGGGLVADVGGAGSALCRQGWAKDLCRASGLGAALWPQDAAAWAEIERQRQRPDGPAPDGRALRDYLARFRDGLYAEPARARLAACTTQPVEQWVARDEALPLYLAATVEGADGPAAMAPAVRDEAARLCAPFVKGGVHRLDAVTFRAEAIACERGRVAGTWRCRYDDTVTCRLQVRQTIGREVCP